MRFQFGKNWSHFLNSLSDSRILQAESSLKVFSGVSDFNGITFLDVGSGSGLFSLAARRLGAKVYSFDYDTDSVNCTQSLKEKYFPEDTNWKVERGSVLDPQYLGRLGEFDFVYSWGVLHHTGKMYEAFENVSKLVKPGGRLFIAIYNDQGAISKIWLLIKKLYNRSPHWGKFILAAVFWLYFEVSAFFLRALTLRNPLPFKRWRELKQARGMSIWHDVVDWIGGYPFEVAKPEEVFSFFKARGFTLQKLSTQKGNHGCNEFLFTK